MSVIGQFGMNTSLDRVLQLVYMSANLFSTFEVQHNIGILKIDEDGHYSRSERTQLLTYFLDLIEYFSQERVQLVQDPSDRTRYALTGLIIGGV